MEGFHSTCLNTGGCCAAARADHRGFEGEYIVERVVDRRSEYTSYTGKLCIAGISANHCTPLSLCGVAVMGAEFCRGDERRPCDLQKVRLTLLCTVVDSDGCKEQGIASIELKHDCAGGFAHGECIRVAAKAKLLRACFLGRNAFDVCLDLCLQTVISRAEILCGRPQAKPVCRSLPLYPRPCATCCLEN